MWRAPLKEARTAPQLGCPLTTMVNYSPSICSRCLPPTRSSRTTRAPIIYATNDLDEEQDFAPVINAIQGDGFNPLWLQVLIVFNPGFTPHQFLSDVEVEAAAAAANPEITLVVTDEIYRCSVVGRK